MEKTIRLLRESGAMLEGHFLLSSGRHGDRYFQCAKLLQYPDRAAGALESIADQIKADKEAGVLDINGVAGPAMGGIIVAYELGRQLGLPAFFTERDDSGAMTLRRGFEAGPGSRILIAEDVVTTMKSSLEAAEVIEGLGGIVAGLACIVDRRAKGIEAPWRVYSAYIADAVSWTADSCELCKQGVSLVKPGSRMF
jgi:orotate phosphoribosyltransferase